LWWSGFFDPGLQCFGQSGTVVRLGRGLRHHRLKFGSGRAGRTSRFSPKALLGITLGAAIIFLALKTTNDRARSVPTLQPVRDAEPTRPEPLRDADLNVAQNAPF